MLFGTIELHWRGNTNILHKYKCTLFGLSTKYVTTILADLYLLDLIDPTEKQTFYTSPIICLEVYRRQKEENSQRHTTLFSPSMCLFSLIKSTPETFLLCVRKLLKDDSPIPWSKSLTGPPWFWTSETLHMKQRLTTRLARYLWLGSNWSVA